MATQQNEQYLYFREEREGGEAIMIIRSQNKEILERFDGFKLLPKDRVKVEQEKESNNNGKDIERCCAYIDDINGRNAIVGTTDRRYEELKEKLKKERKKSKDGKNI